MSGRPVLIEAQRRVIRAVEAERTKLQERLTALEAERAALQGKLKALPNRRQAAWGMGIDERTYRKAARGHTYKLRHPLERTRCAL